MGFLDLFRLESRSRASAPAPLPSSALALLWGSAGRSTARVDRAALLSAYASNAQIARVTRFVARSISSVRWRAFRARDASTAARARAWLEDPTRGTRSVVLARAQEAGLLDEEIVVHPALDVLHRLSGGQLSEVDVRFVGQAQIELVGECFLRIIRDETGRPNSLFVLTPTQIESFAVGSKPWKIRTSTGTSEEVPAADIVMIKDVDPSNPYGRGVGIFGALAAEVDTDAEAAETIRTRFKNRGLPEVLIELVTSGRGAQTSVKDAEKEAMETRFLQKFASGDKAGGVHFVNREVKITPLGAKVVDLGVTQLRNDFAELVRKTRGVPPELLGQVENSNRATIEAAVEIWARYGMTPALNQWERAYATILSTIGAEDIVYLYDDPIPPNETARAMLVQSAQWALSRDEIREIAGLDPTLDDSGSLVSVPAGVTLEPADALASLTSDLSMGDEPT